jgi:hypothetical protein
MFKQSFERLWHLCHAACPKPIQVRFSLPQLQNLLFHKNSEILMLSLGMSIRAKIINELIPSF